MEKIIEIDLYDEDDFYERYNRKKVSKSLINYLIDETKSNLKKEKIKIIVNSFLDKNIDCKSFIIEGIKDEYNKSYKKQFYISTNQFFYLILGIIVIFISTLISAQVIREVVLICGWVLIWAMAELEIFSDTEGRKRRKILKKLLNSSIEVKNK